MSEPVLWPKISVMVITYNQEHWIEETLDSVLCQGYPNLELVVADDCSTDSTPQILLRYEAAYPGVVKPVLNPVNLGITGNCNAALEACTGELVAVLGGDDIFLPGKLHAQARQFDDPEVVLSYHAVDVFLSQTDETLFLTNQTAREDLNDVYEIIRKGGIPGASSVMVRRSACPAKGFDARLPTVSDWLFYIDVALCGRVVKLDGIYGRYRKHGKGASDRTYELLDESLMALDIVCAEHPDDRLLAAACDEGKARYIAGEVYRQLSKNPDIAGRLADRMLEHGHALKYRVLWGVAQLLCRVPTLAKSVTGILASLKSFLKRRIA